ncbi:hypothetical protein [Streptomyces narbonensis]|uniref:hypothetical protein n=1 Tax=Streptomyces narbonensis TaxID=67333 RepID=UPI00167C3AF1|nr:hypothetical protein [Streptomyces narbonensis]GGW11353.1 hypothetical protein GCM10010230_64660 [Streptomyces narbonensis]
MFAYELHRINHAQLVREAAAQRLGHEAAVAKGLRLFGRRHGGHGTEGRVTGGDRGRFVRAA